MGNSKLIKYLNDVKFSVNSYTMNQLSQICGAESVRDEKYFKNTVELIINTREKTKTALAELGFEFTDSKSNFLFVKHNRVKAKYIFEELKKKKIYVRYWNKPRIDNYLRITVGTPEEMSKAYFGIEGNCKSLRKDIIMKHGLVERKTRETEVSVEVTIDGKGIADISTGIGFF